MPRLFRPRFFFSGESAAARNRRNRKTKDLPLTTLIALIRRGDGFRGPRTAPVWRGLGWDSGDPGDSP
jgi:hypothetical protein